jgi:hypothetical protein
MRKPIFISAQCIALVSLFRRHADLDHVFLDHDLRERAEPGADPDADCRDYEAAAKELVAQLDDQYCMGFMIALRDEASRLVAEWEERKKTPILPPSSS